VRCEAKTVEEISSLGPEVLSSAMLKERSAPATPLGQRRNWQLLVKMTSVPGEQTHCLRSKVLDV